MLERIIKDYGRFRKKIIGNTKVSELITMTYFFFFHLFIQGAFLGCVFGIIISVWLAVGAFIYPPDKNILPVSIEQCSIFNSTTMNATVYHHFQPHE